MAAWSHVKLDVARESGAAALVAVVRGFDSGPAKSLIAELRRAAPFLAERFAGADALPAIALLDANGRKFSTRRGSDVLKEHDIDAAKLPQMLLFGTPGAPRGRGVRVPFLPGPELANYVHRSLTPGVVDVDATAGAIEEFAGRVMRPFAAFLLLGGGDGEAAALAAAQPDALNFVTGGMWLGRVADPDDALVASVSRGAVKSAAGLPAVVAVRTAKAAREADAPLRAFTGPFGGEDGAAALNAFMETESYPLVAELSQSVHMALHNSKLHTVLIVGSGGDLGMLDPSVEDLITALAPSMVARRGELAFVYADVSFHGPYVRGEYLVNFKKMQLPTVVVRRSGGSSFYFDGNWRALAPEEGTAFESLLGVALAPDAPLRTCTSAQGRYGKFVSFAFGLVFDPNPEEHVPVLGMLAIGGGIIAWVLVPRSPKAKKTPAASATEEKKADRKSVV